jgi:hypothetical protein
MKKIYVVPVLLLGLIVSCKDSPKSVSPSSPAVIPLTPNSPAVDYDAQMEEEAKNHPAINAPIIEQNKVKMILGSPNGAITSSVKYQYDYFADGRIKSIGSGNGNLVDIVYSNGLVVSNYDGKSYNLDNNGLAKSANDNDKTKFFYKDGFLVRTNKPNDFKLLYSSTGNLIKASKGDESLDYTYTDYPNNVRQEILKMQEYSNTIRDTYLGRYSTNLIKDISYNGLIVATFEYEFDSQKRVTKITMNRKSSATFKITNKIIIGPTALIEYNLSY